MCLLIAGTASQVRTTLLTTEGLIADIFDSNRDGVGAMFTEGGLLHTKKLLPQNLGEAIEFIRGMPDDDRQLAIHWRMRTHGDTDLENCHPYPVIDGIALMHNGVLSQGNYADKSKSDTWHYIKDVVAPMLSEAPSMFLNKAWLELVESDIGNSNRFAIMDHHGNLRILNKHTGTDVKGMWFSNTYAWSPELLIEGYKKYTPSKGAWGNYLKDSRFDNEDTDWTGPIWGNKSAKTSALTLVKDPDGDGLPGTDEEITAEAVFASLDDQPVYLQSMIEQRPTFVLSTILDACFVYVKSQYAYDEDETQLIEMIECGDVVGLAAAVYADRKGNKAVAENIAKILCWYSEFEEIVPMKAAAADPVLVAANAEIDEAIAEFELAEAEKRLVRLPDEEAVVEIDYAAG